MKKNSVLTLVIAAVTSITLISGAAFAWLTSSSQTNSISLSSGSIQTKVVQLASTNTSDKSPGDKVRLNPNADPIVISNTGTSNAIVRVSFDRFANLDFSGDVLPPGDYSQADYEQIDGFWEISPERIEKIFDILIEDTAFTKVENEFFAKIDASGTAKLGDVFVDLKSELGGGVRDPLSGAVSPERPIEQGVSFDVGYTLTAVQNTFDAAADIFGEEVAISLPENWFEGI